ncbi:MAG: hypothetical protein KBG09_01115 [Syntrophobacterales bacterium]|nr:hypothetical protein [Syntrophobacterales bacterium]
MRKTTAAIAGDRIDFVSHGVAAENIFFHVDALWNGFLVAPGKRRADAECLVFFDHRKTYPQRFGAEPTVLERMSAPWQAELAERMGRIFPGRLEEATAMIGFLNGCLIFDSRSRRGAIYVFYTPTAVHAQATLAKLVFIYVCLIMAAKNRFLIHGAGIKKRRRREGYLFVGKSGAGKSTIAALSVGDVILSDDATLVEAGEDGFILHATPFTQTNMHRSRPPRWHLQKERLRRIIFLHQALETRMEPREGHYACMELLTHHVQCYGLLGPALRTRAFDFCRRLCGLVPAVDLYFLKEGGFWELVTAG